MMASTVPHHRPITCARPEVSKADLEPTKSWSLATASVRAPMWPTKSRSPMPGWQTSLTLALDNVNRFENLVFTDQTDRSFGLCNALSRRHPRRCGCLHSPTVERMPLKRTRLQTQQAADWRQIRAVRMHRDRSNRDGRRHCHDTASSAASSTEDSAIW